MYVIGTAGHVDHGKSTLVKALTGIDPDRLREEKERGLTIDLGFAWLTLPSGREVSIVDVPGHERFINNMLAGVGGIDLALLVVAADEAVMPQTREHLAILDLLQVRRGVVAIAKADLVDEELLELVQEEVADTLRGTTLDGAPLVAVSALTGQGLPQLVDTIDKLLEETPTRQDLGRPRLPVDRSFTIAGFGTVVTGTLIDGTLSVGQEVEMVPGALRSRVRGLQTHQRKLQEAVPGSRVAVNVSGVSHEAIQRGHVLTTPGWLRPTQAVDVRLRLISHVPRPLRHNIGVTFHTGSSETVARVRLLEKEEAQPGEETWAQVRLDNPLAVVKGDFFVIRSTQTTLGGGTIVEPYARRHHRFHAATLRHLEILAQGSARDVLLETLEAAEPCDVRVLGNRSNLPEEEVRRGLEALVAEAKAVALGNGAVFYSAQGWKRLSLRAAKALEAYHQQYPARKGAPREELRSRLRLSSSVFSVALAQLVAEGEAAEEGALVRLPSHGVQLTPSQRSQAEAYVERLRSNPYSPPTDNPIDPELLNVLVQEGKVVKVSETVVYEANAYQEIVERIVQHTREQGTITVGEVRDMFNTSRKYALALLEHLDQRHITRRVGDERVLR